MVTTIKRKDGKILQFSTAQYVCGIYCAVTLNSQPLDQFSVARKFKTEKAFHRSVRKEMDAAGDTLDVKASTEL